ncbi:MAG: 50S ribosomal protein L1, partial [Nitrospirae bacterium]|nr:50S ribosomal protein L1 [Nitrospirota bacterium]
MGKKFDNAESKVDLTREYSVEEAIALVKESTFVKFDETVDIAINLGVDAKKSDQMVRGTVVLPYGT